MRLVIPDFSLVLLVGPSGAGKSTFAQRHFRPTEVISSDQCRALISDDESSFDVNEDAFEVLHLLAGKRLARRRLTVIDATNVEASARAPLVALARRYHCFAAAIVFDMPPALCQERNRKRPERQVPRHAVRNQVRQMRRSLHGLKKERIRYVYHLRGPEDMDSVTVERQRLWTDRRDERGPFDVIGDVHGCFDELVALLGKLGYELEEGAAGGDGPGVTAARPPEGRKAVFLGDLVDRGPRSPDVLRLVMSMVDSQHAICLPGNHDMKLLKKLRGHQVRMKHGLAETWEQLAGETPEFRGRVAEFLDSLVSHYVLDKGRLVVAHAGLREDLQGRSSGAVRSFALYGETTGETDELGLPVRYNWAAEYRGRAMVVYGHTPVPEVEWLNGTACLDTGCVFGGRLSALRYPEKELVCIEAARTYCEPARPLEETGNLSAQQQADTDLDLEDVAGKRVITTGLRGNVTLRPEQTAAALEVMSRFAADPRWLIYLPPTMAAPQTSRLPHLLEHPETVFDEYARLGLERVICQEKHMGSRCVVVVCRDAATPRRRFGVLEADSGICYTRTGRRFFSQASFEAEVLDRLRRALTRADFWQRLETDWIALDCELLPWSAKARELIERQYAPVGAAARSGLGQAAHLLEQTRLRGVDLAGLDERMAARGQLVERYVEAYGHYCWPVASVEDLFLAPFHVLAGEGRLHTSHDHLWHMERAAELGAADPDLLRVTRYRLVDLADASSRAEASAWWTELTGQGGEGMVVKPIEFVARGKKGLLQPGIKCRGPEYLRIIYGPEYDHPENLERLRRRSLGRKRSLALRELALGLEALERFVDRQPLRRVHECVFGVLALESEPVDPRL